MTNLHFTPHSTIDTAKCQECYEDYSYEWNAEFGCFIFEEDEEMLDNLELQLDAINQLNSIRGYFEAE